jgi:hypothetical protein
MESWFEIASLILGGVNLLFILKILYNDLHELRDLLIKHLVDHGKGDV